MDVLLTRPLRKFRSRWLSWNGGWRRQLEWPTVQLKGRAKIEPGTLWWLYVDDSLAVGQRDGAFDGSSMVLVHVNAAFRIQDLIQAFSRARLRRWAVFRRRQGARSYGEKDHGNAERNCPHEHIIHAAIVAGCRQRQSGCVPAFADAFRAGRS
jgi:hypothetical protein